MKRQTQETGVRTYFGEDLISLQSEPLKALDAFFAQYGQCIIQGCEVTGNVDGTYDVAAGMVALDVADRGITVMPFGGAAGVVFPLYMHAQVAPIERLYDDGEVKPIAYEYAARVSAQPLPEGTPTLALSGVDSLRFVDVVQDAGHRFISDAERSKWNRILEQAKEYADGVAATGSEAALRSAKEYTDTRETAILADADTKDAAMLRTAKEYADRIVAALAGSAPETLDTLQELAAALGNDPNFAATVMQMIGEKATKDEVNAALSGKFDKTGGDVEGEMGVKGNTAYRDGGRTLFGRDKNGAFINSTDAYGETTAQLRMWNDGKITFWKPSFGNDQFVDVWHGGNFVPEDCMQNKGMSVDISQEMIGTGFQYDTGGSGTTGPFLSAGSPKYPLQVVCGYWAGNGGHQNLKFRTRNGDTGVWNPWYNVYCDGNLGPATAASAGLMSAADKAKLDDISEGGMKLLGAGVVSGGGNIMKKKGAVTHAVRSGGTGYFRVFHTVGHTNYEVQATCVQHGNSNGYASIRGKTESYFDVWTADDDSVNDVSFFFQIYEF